MRIKQLILLYSLFYLVVSCSNKTRNEKTQESIENAATKSEILAIDFYKSTLDSFSFEKFILEGKAFEEIEKKELCENELKSLPEDIIENIRKQYQSETKANFANEYIIIEWPCGSSCQMNAIIELKTGKICKTFKSSLGIEFRAYSNLLIINPPDSSEIYDEDYRKLYGEPEFFIWEDYELSKIKN